MRRCLPYISQCQQTLINDKLSNIVAKTQPEKILCYGMRTESHHAWSAFASASERLPRTTLDLLVISSVKDKRHRESIANVIEHLCSEEVRIICVVHSLDAVNSGLREGNPFFVTLYHHGIVLYEQNPAPLATPEPGVTQTLDNPKRLQLAQSFYQSSVECATNENFEPAMLLLHQSVELSCAELLKYRLGYRPTTHSLRKLFALTENVSTELSALFPLSSEEENNLFELLQCAYVDVRYKEDYTIQADDVWTLTERVSELLGLVQQLCTEKQIAPADTFCKKTGTVIPLPDFESIRFSTMADVVLHHGERPGLAIETDGSTSIFQYEVEGNRLHLWVSNNTTEPLPYATIHVTYAKLNGLVADDCGNITCSEPIESEFLGIVHNGKCSIDLTVNVSTLDATVTKSGMLKLSGSADRATLLNTGPGELDGCNLHISEAKVTIKDAGNISACVDDELAAHLEGNGTLKLKGEPKLKNFFMKKSNAS